MTKRMEQSRRHGHYDPRFQDRVLAFVPREVPLPATPDPVPQAPAAFTDPISLTLLPPLPSGTEERVAL